MADAVPMRTRHWLIRAVVLGSALALGACSSTQTDLERFVSKVKARKKQPIPSVPDLKSYPGFSYASEELRNPFQPMKREKESAEASGGIKPDQDRRKEPLEDFPLNQLTLVGIIQQPDASWALIRAPGGEIHRVGMGNYLGRNDGQIVDIDAQELTLSEIIPDGLGGWRKQDTRFGMPQRDEG
ncbi:MAG: pilus assembly protein PilP [Gammaproteobacteria bacterium]